MNSVSSREKQNKRLFFSGVLALSLANITVKLLGLLFKIPIANILSEESLGAGEGLGYFSSAYTVYTWLFMVATSGLPNGISIVVSEYRQRGKGAEIKKIFRSTLLLFSAVGVALTLLLFFGAGGISAAIQNRGSRFAMMAIAPTLLSVSVMSVFRGYFYGFQEMVPSAVSEVIEAIGKLIFGIGGAYFAYINGYSAPVVASFAIFGVTVGVFLGMLFLVFSKGRYERRGRLTAGLPHLPSDEKEGHVLRRVLRLSIPITVASSVMSLTGLIDVATMMGRLQDIGYTAGEASSLYGSYTMLAVPLYNLPVVLLSPLSSAVIPLLSGYLADGNKSGAKRVTESALRMVSIVVVPASLGMSVFSYEILSLFYAEAAARTAAPLLSVLAGATFFLGLLTISNAALQANKMAGKTVFSMSMGALVKLLSGIFLVGIPEIGIYGVPLGTVLCYLTITGINFYFMARYNGVFPSISHSFVRPFLSGGIAVLLGKYLFLPRLLLILPKTPATLIAILLVACLYGVCLILFRTVTRGDILLLPGGEKIYAFLRKRKWIGDK